MTDFLETAEGRIAYDDRGAGPPVVCVPGMLGLRAEYRFLTPLLVAAGRRVVTVDSRGMGDTDVAWPEYGSAPTGRDVLALIGHLDAGPALVVGCSSGAASAVYAAGTAPELVCGIALLAPFVRDGPPSLGLTVARALAGIPGVAVPLWLSHFAKLYPGGRPADFAAYREALAANLREPGRAGVARTYIRDTSHAEAASLLPRVTAPTVVVMGGADPDFPDPVAEATWVADTLGGQRVILDGLGHHPHVQAPERVAQAVLGLAGG